MADVKWIKIATDIFDDEKILLIENMPESDGIIVIWFKLLCMAGKQNNCGVFTLNDKIAYTDEMLATIFRRPLNIVRLALQTFEQFGMVEIENNAYIIPNWEKHQNLEKMHEIKEQTRQRVAKCRENKRLQECNISCNATVQECNATDKIRIDKNRIDEDNIKASPFDVFSPDVREALNAFIAMRKRIKKPMTENAIQRLTIKLNKLSSVAEEQIKILNQAEDGCWTDIYPLKPDKQQSSKNSNIFLQIAEEEGLI